MEQIYKKINNHKYLNNGDIKRFISIQSNGKVKTLFKNNPDNLMGFVYLDPHIIIDKKVLIKRVVEIIDLTDTKIEICKDSNKSTFLIDLYNIYLINTLFHELEHAIQYEKVVNQLTYKTKILKDNIKFIHMNPKLYYKNHDLYYHEYDAVIKSLIKTFDFINNNCKDLNKNAIIEFNSIMAKILYHSYGNEYINDDVSVIYNKFESPISYTEYLSNCWQDLKARKRLNICIRGLKKQSKTEYLKLVNGFKISGETLDLLYDISTRNYVTNNILDEVKKIDKQKKNK